MVWSVVYSSPLPTFPSERWELYPLTEIPGTVLYGWRVIMPTVPPSDWNTLGFWGMGQVLGGELTVGRTLPIPLIATNGQPAIVGIWPQLVDYLIEPPLNVVIAVAVNRWVPRGQFQLLAYS